MSTAPIPPGDAARPTPKSRKPRRKTPVPETPPTGTPDWMALADALTPTQRTRLNRVHRRLDILVHGILTGLYAGPTTRRRRQAPRPTPGARDAAERLAATVNSIPWLP